MLKVKVTVLGLTSYATWEGRDEPTEVADLVAADGEGAAWVQVKLHGAGLGQLVKGSSYTLELTAAPSSAAAKPEAPAPAEGDDQGLKNVRAGTSAGDKSEHPPRNRSR